MARQRKLKRHRKQSNAVFVRFVVFFVVLLVFSNVILEGDWSWTTFRQDYGHWLARVIGNMLDPFVGGVLVHDDFVSGPGLSMRIVRHCDGLDAMSMLVAAILAFPAPWRTRIVGTLASLPIMFAINVLRILILYIIGSQSRWLFDIVHVYAFQVSIIAAAAAGFVVWARSATVGLLAQRFGRQAAA